MWTTEQLLKAVRSRKESRGIVTADRYLADLAKCLSGNGCPTSLMGSESNPGDWQNALKAGAGTLTYRNDECEVIVGIDIDGKVLGTGETTFSHPVLNEESVAAGYRKAPNIKNDLPERAIGGVDVIITTPKQDRDGDKLFTQGAIVDEKQPLLWQHFPMDPIGGFVRTLQHSKNRLMARFAMANTQLARDAMELIAVKGLRISHGFRPIKFEPIDEDDPYSGFKILEFEIMETSLVSIPSNTDAVIEAWSEQKLHHPAVKQWAKSYHDARPVQVTGKRFGDPIVIDGVKHDVPVTRCACGTKSAAEEFAAPLSLKTVIIRDGNNPEEMIVAEGLSNEEISKAIESAAGPVKKDFDVERQHLEPSALEYDWVSRYCNCEVKQLHEINTGTNHLHAGSFLTGLRNALSAYTLDDTRNIHGGMDSGRETPPAYDVIQLNSRESDDFLTEGISFYRGEANIVVKVWPTWWGYKAKVYSRIKDAGAAHDVVEKAWAWAAENNFLKGECFSLLGDFHKATSESWGDLFLTEANLKPVKSALRQLNEKGKDSPNRGMIWMGPPGTGKTLAGRILRNSLAGATFIWCSARDLQYLGGSGGIMHAFDLAKELAPAVIFMEDIDAWLHRSTLDLLKTEMDGVGRSTGILTILTTNHPESLPKALIDRPGRFHDVLKFDLPNDQQRASMIAKWLPDLEPAEQRETAKATEGLSGAHVYELCHFAKTISEQDEIGIGDAVKSALKKITEQREAIGAKSFALSKSFDTKRMLANRTDMVRQQVAQQIVKHYEKHRDIDAVRWMAKPILDALSEAEAMFSHDVDQALAELVGIN